MQNRPGMLAKVSKLLADGGVNIEGISAAAGTDIGLVQLVTDKSRKARQILDKTGIPFVAQDVVLMAMSNRPGELARVVSEIARRGINLNYVYATACACKDDCRCYAIISAPNLKKVLAACRACGVDAE